MLKVAQLFYLRLFPPETSVATAISDGLIIESVSKILYKFLIKVGIHTEMPALT